MTERVFFYVRRQLRAAVERGVPLFRRLLRFAALPVYFFSGIDWDECPKSRIGVLFDLFYIFFHLKYYPDNYSLCRLWEVDRNRWYLYYGSIYNPYPRYRLRKEVQPNEYLIVFNDKHICYQLCKAAGLPVPEQAAYIPRSEDGPSSIARIVESNPSRELIVKPVGGKGGAGIILVRLEDGRPMCQNGDQKFPLAELSLQTPVVVQYRITQHPDLQAVSGSTNTARVVTLLTRDNDVLLLGGISKFGRGNAFLDNRSRGGVGAGIDVRTGRLTKYALDFKSRRHLRHPESGVVFEGFQLPYWERVVQLAVAAQRLFPYYRLLGLDVAFGVDGPVLLEINASHDNVGLEQASGPILADVRVWEEFRRYGLLINRPQLKRPS